MEMTIENQKKVVGLVNDLIEKSWENETFKKEFMSSPVAVIERVTGQKVNLPANTKVIVEDQSNDQYIYLNIPQKIDITNFELSDEQLEVVAGGEVAVTATVAVIGGLAILGAGIYVGTHMK